MSLKSSDGLGEHSAPVAKKARLDLSDGELVSSEEEGSLDLQPESFAEIKEENEMLRKQLRLTEAKLERSELDRKNAEAYVKSLREHVELLSGKLQEHRKALRAARDALLAEQNHLRERMAGKGEQSKEKELCEVAAKDGAGMGLSSRGQPMSPSPNGYHCALKNSANSSTGGQASDTPFDQPACVQSSAIASHNQATPAAVAPISVEANSAAALIAAAEEGMRQGGFVYDERSQMYYDYSSGYYYDPNSQLYYDNNTGTFYSYDAHRQMFDYHSRCDISHLTAQAEESKEAGTDSSDCSDTESELSDCSQDTAEDSPKQYPPCIRAIVLSSERLDLGTLFLLTCDGGSVGRERGLGHAIRIPEIGVSKVHAKVDYDLEEGVFSVTDYGSRNGTFINDERLSESQQRSEPHPLHHGDILQLGLVTRLLIHIHPGQETCNACEPGQVKAWLAARPGGCSESAESKESQHRKELQRLKSRYGLSRRDVGDGSKVDLAKGCRDRAAARRKVVGSEAPDVERPDDRPASVHRPIDTANKGHQLLKKLGWQDGDGLGQRNAGRKEPVNVAMRLQHGCGLGFEAAVSSSNNLQSRSSTAKWEKAQARYSSVQARETESIDIFAD